MNRLIQEFVQDLRFAVRQLRKSPGFTVAAVLTLTIGIGVNAASFSIMDGLVLRPLAIPDLDRVMSIYARQNGGDEQEVTLGDAVDWQRQSRSFEQLAIHRSADRSLTGAGDAAHVEVDYVSPEFFGVMRTQALDGRLFDPSEYSQGRDRVVVLSNGFWARQFNADPELVGRKIELDQHDYTVIGILPKSMQYPMMVDIFAPLAPTPAQLSDRSALDYQVTGRLRAGVSVDAARAEMNLIAGRLTQAYPATNNGRTVGVDPLRNMVNGSLTPLYCSLVQGATLILLLAVCANVANLQLARGLQRRPELAMRTALGASRGRILRQLLTENVLLGLIGAVGGLALAQANLHWSATQMPARIARMLAGWSTISINGRVVCFSLVVAIGAGLISGLMPALAAMRIELVGQLKSGSRSIAGAGRAKWLRIVFAVTQIALALSLAIGAVLMAKGMGSMLHLGDRYNPQQMLVFRFHLPSARYDTAEKQAAWWTQSLTALRAQPGAKQVEVTSTLPLSDDGWVNDCEIENQPLAPGQFRGALRLPVSNGYYDEFHIPILSGRAFNQSDVISTQLVAIVSRDFVARYFAGQNPLGKHIRLGKGPDQTPWLTIVGVAADTDYTLFRRDTDPVAYLSTAQLPPNSANYAVTTEGDPKELGPALRKTLANLDAGVPIIDMETYAQRLDEQLTGLKFVDRTLRVDAIVALLLAAIGIFGVMANLVAERTREIGVRLAMGASREDVLGMMMKRAARLAAVGLAFGLVLAFFLAHGVANLLYGVSPSDPVVFSGITVAVAGVAVVASWIPARRAARIEPMAALRDE